MAFRVVLACWQLSLPGLRAAFIPCSQSTIDQLVKEKMPRKGSRWWFSWRRREFPLEEVCLSSGCDTRVPGEEGSRVLGMA